MTKRQSACLIFWLLSNVATAQETMSTGDRMDAERIARGAARQLTKVTAPVSEGTLPGYQLALESTVKDKVATASGLWESVDGDETYELKLSGPIGDDPSSEAELFTLDGLPASTKATFTFQKFLWGYSAPAGSNPQDVVCKLAGIDQSGDCDPKQLSDAKGPKLFDARQAFDKLTKEEKAVACLALQIGPHCTRGRFRAVTLLQPFLTTTQFSATQTFFGISATVGRKRFEYLAEGTLVDRAANHNNWSASAHAARLYPKAGLFLFRLNYKSVWSDAQDEPEEVCRPIDGADGASHCKTISIGEPTNQHSTTASVEWRRFLSADVAINPRVSYNVTKKYWQLELPTYFLKTEKALTGGARLGWRSDKREVTLSIFVGGSALSPI